MLIHKTVEAKIMWEFSYINYDMTYDTTEILYIGSQSLCQCQSSYCEHFPEAVQTRINLIPTELANLPVGGAGSVISSWHYWPCSEVYLGITKEPFSWKFFFVDPNSSVRIFLSKTVKSRNLSNKKNSPDIFEFVSNKSRNWISCKTLSVFPFRSPSSLCPPVDTSAILAANR